MAKPTSSKTTRARSPAKAKGAKVARGSKAPTAKLAEHSGPAAEPREAPVRRDVEIVEERRSLSGDLGLDAEVVDPIDPEVAAEIEASLDRSFEARTHAIVPEVLDASDPGGASDAKALAPVDPIATYLAEIRRYPVLSREDEQALAIRYRETGDPLAAERLVTSNLRFVVKIAAEYSKFGAKLIDLIQEGNVGLMHAVKEFNPYKNVRLITYAVWWIRGYIQEYLMRQYSLVRIGTTQNQRKLFYRLQREQRQLDSLGQEPNFALLSSRLGVPQDEVETMAKRLSGRDVSLSQPFDSESRGSLLDMESGHEPGIEESVGRAEELALLRQNIDSIRDGLSEKETFLLERRLLADEPLTLQEIGEKYGVTREAVRQMEARLIGRIRSALMDSLSGEADQEDGASAEDGRKR